MPLVDVELAEASEQPRRWVSSVVLPVGDATLADADECRYFLRLHPEVEPDLPEKLVPGKWGRRSNRGRRASVEVDRRRCSSGSACLGRPMMQPLSGCGSGPNGCVCVYRGPPDIDGPTALVATPILRGLHHRYVRVAAEHASDHTSLAEAATSPPDGSRAQSVRRRLAAPAAATRDDLQSAWTD